MEKKKETVSKETKKKILIIRSIAAIVLVLTLVLSTVQIARYLAEKKRQEELRRIAAVEQTEQPTATPTEEPTPIPDVWPEPKEYKPNERDINFEELWAINPNVIAWIEIPGTKIDYPLLGYEADDFYLNHDIYGKKSVHGTIYIDDLNDDDLNQPHVVLYGHNMKDGSMFAGLHKYRNRSFFEQNRLIKIYTPKGQLDYEIFAAYERDDLYILKTYDFNDKQTHENYLNEIRNNTNENANIIMDDITVKDSIITLSTCVSGGRDEFRYIVQAAFIRP